MRRRIRRFRLRAELCGTAGSGTQQNYVRMLGAGAAVTFFGRVFGENEVGFGERLIGHGSKTVEACHGLGDALRDGLGYGVGDVFEPVQGCGFGGVRRAAEPEHPEPNRMNVPVFKVVEIGSVGFLVVVAVAVFARVFEPGFRIGFRGSSTSR